MKPSSGSMGGGYRRKADQDTLGRNSRVRYATYVPFDKRMIPANSARIYANSNKVVGSRLQGAGISYGPRFSLLSWTPTDVNNVNLDTWRYVVNWQVENRSNTPISYTVKAKTSNNTLLTFGSAYSAQNGVSSISSQSIDILDAIPNPDILQAGQNTFEIQFIDNTDNSIMFTYTTPVINLFDFENISQTPNSVITELVHIPGRLNAAFEFTHTVIPNSYEQVLSMVIYYKEINQPSPTLLGAPSYINGQNTATSGIYVTIPNNGQQVTTTFSREFSPTPSGGSYEVYAVVRFLPSQQTNLPDQGLYNFFSVQLPTVTYMPPITGATFVRGGTLVEHAGARTMNIDITSLTGGSTAATYNVKYELEILGSTVYQSPVLTNFTNVTKQYIISNFSSENLHVTAYDIIFEARRLRFIIQDGFNTDFVSAWSDPFTYSPKIEIVLQNTTLARYIIYGTTAALANNVCTVFDTGTGANLALALDDTQLVQTGFTENNEPFTLKVQFTDQGNVVSQLTYGQYQDFNTIQTNITASQPVPGLSIGLIENETLTNVSLMITPVNWPLGVTQTATYGFPATWTKSMTDITTFDLAQFTCSFSSITPHDTYNMVFSASNGTRLDEVGASLEFETSYTVYRNNSTTSATGPTTGSPALDPYSLPYNLQNISRTSAIEGPVKLDATVLVNYRSFAIAQQTFNLVLPPKVTAFTADIDTQNATNESYDVRLTGFTGFTAFINNENKDYEFDIIFKNGNTPLHTKTVTWNTVTNATFPYVLCTTDRAGTDASWWTHTSSGTHTIEIVLKYNFNDGTLGVNQTFTLQTLSSAATLTYYEYEILNLATLTDPVTNQPVSLPYHIGTGPANKAFNIATASQFSYLPTSAFSWECEWELDISQTGSVHDVGIDFGPPNNTHATATGYWGWSFLKQGTTPYHFLYPQGNFNIQNFGGNTLTAATLPYTPGGTYPQNTLRWVCRYDHLTHTNILWMYLNNTLLTGFPVTRTYNSNQLANMPNGPYEYAANKGAYYLTLSHTSHVNNNRDEKFRSCIVRRTSL